MTFSCSFDQFLILIFDIYPQVMALFTLRFHMEISLITAVATSLLFYPFLAWLARLPTSREIENTPR